jgi:hypothetical protein
MLETLRNHEPIEIKKNRNGKSVALAPNSSLLRHKSLKELSELRPIKVFTRVDSEGNQFVGSFGLMLSDGTKETNNSKCNREDQLPSNIRKIDVFFRKSERAFHSMVFYGDTILRIGFTAVTDLNLTQRG